MCRTPLLLVLLLLALCATGGTAYAQDPPPLAATLAGCHDGPTAKERFAVFTASMPALRGTDRMAIRFSLEQRRSRRWARVVAPKLGRFVRSSPGRSGFVYTKRVEQLREGASYRAVVTFRWYRADGAVQRSVVRRTPACEQPDQRPDLRVVAFEIEPAGEESRFLVTVANEGRTAAGRFEVGVAGGERDVKRAVPGLAPGDRVTVELRAPRCAAGRQLVAKADVRDAVDEASERGGEMTRVCP
jgi:hypothetical protein